MQAANLQRLSLSLFTSFALGAVQVFAFAPFGFWPLAFLSLAAYFYLCRGITPKTAFVNGLAFGYGLYGVGVSWVYVSLATYGGMPFWMGAISVLGFAGILALFIALASFTVVRYFAVEHHLFAWPLVWVVFEWMKSWVLTGFPWLDIGYTQTSSWLFGWAPIGGVYLVSFITLVIAVLLKQTIQTRHYSFLTAIIVIMVISWFVNTLTWSRPTENILRVGIVQANIPINNKWQAESLDKLINKYRALSDA